MISLIINTKMNFGFITILLIRMLMIDAKEDIAVESHKARSIANKYFDSKLDSILKDVKEMKNLIRQKQWIDDYHKNNVGLLQIDQKKLLQEKRMLGVRNLYDIEANDGASLGTAAEELRSLQHLNAINKGRFGIKNLRSNYGLDLMEQDEDNEDPIGNDWSNQIFESKINEVPGDENIIQKAMKTMRSVKDLLFGLYR